MGQKWTEEWQWYLLNTPPRWWGTIWPENTYEGLRVRRRNLKRDIKAGAKPMPEQPPDYNETDTPEDIHERLHRVAEELGRLITPENMDDAAIPEGLDVSYHYGFIKNSEGQIEYTKPLPSIRSGRKLKEFPQATPANITPSKKRPPKRPYRSLYVFSDAQIDYRRIGDELVPIHDERALRVSRLICADLRPDLIINLGDTIDHAALSRFKPDSDHFSRTLGPSYQRVHDMYAELRSDNPRARIIEVDSNHNVRLRDFVIKNMPQIYGVRQAGSAEGDYPVMSYPYLANLQHLNVEWVGGYGAAEFLYGGDLAFRHGTVAVSNGSTAAKASKQEPEMHVVQGHAHRAETFHRTTRSGKYLASVVVGALCRTTGEVPSYHSAVDDHNRVVRHQEDWVQSVLEIQDYGGGNYVFNHILIRDGKAYYNGKEYNGND